MYFLLLVSLEKLLAGYLGLFPLPEGKKLKFVYLEFLVFLEFILLKNLIIKFIYFNLLLPVVVDLL